MSVAPVTEGCTNAWGLVRHLRPCWCPRAMLIWVTCTATRDMVMLVPRPMSGSVVQLWLGSVLMACVTIGVTGTKCVET